MSGYVHFDCYGIKEIVLTAKHDFSKSMFVNVENADDPVTAKFTLRADKMGEFFAENGTIDNFSIKILPGFTFSMDGIQVDMNPKENLSSIVWPLDEEYDEREEAGLKRLSKWEGFYVKELKIGLPEAFNL